MLKLSAYQLFLSFSQNLKVKIERDSFNEKSKYQEFV